MKSVITALTLVLLCVAATALAQPQDTIGLYFDLNHGQTHYSPMPYEAFSGYVYCHAVSCDLGAVEFAVAIPPGVRLLGFSVPQGSLAIGNPSSGLSIAYWPPLDPGYNLLCTFDFFATSWCSNLGGSLINAPVGIHPHPETGLARYTCRTLTAGQSEYDVKLFYPLTSVLCPVTIAAHDKSWGSIKSLFGK
jgi:hypothetical protein